MCGHKTFWFPTLQWLQESFSLADTERLHTEEESTKFTHQYTHRQSTHPHAHCQEMKCNENV